LYFKLTVYILLQSKSRVKETNFGERNPCQYCNLRKYIDINIQESILTVTILIHYAL